MKPSITLFYYDNCVGERKDAQLICDALTNHFDIYLNDEQNNVQNVFINGEKKYHDLVSSSKIYICNNFYASFEDVTSVLICNEEWVSKTYLKIIPDFDFVIVKSNYAKKILENYNDNVVVLPFWSQDRFDSDIKEENQVFHLAGRSIQKGTELLIDIPGVYVQDATERFKEDTNLKCNYHGYFLSDKDIDLLYNKSNLHLCPSIYEGHGHYMYEALTCGKKPIVTKIPVWYEYLPDEVVTYLDVEKTKSKNNFDFFSEKYKNEMVFREGFIFDKNQLLNQIENNIDTKFNPEIRKFALELFDKRKKDFLNFFLDLL